MLGNYGSNVLEAGGIYTKCQVSRRCIRKLFHPLVLTSTPESDTLAAHLLLFSLGIRRTAGGQQQAHSSLQTENTERKHHIR